MDRKVTSPSATKCVLASGSWDSFVKDLKNSLYSSSSISFVLGPGWRRREGGREGEGGKTERKEGRREGGRGEG